jgi:hypothetical protein
MEENPMGKLEKDQTQKEKNPFLEAHVETPIYCPGCFAGGDSLDAWFFMSEATHEYLSVRVHCRGCDGAWWAVYSLISMDPVKTDVITLGDEEISE